MIETIKKFINPLKISSIKQCVSKAIVSLVVAATLSVTLIPADVAHAAVHNPSPNNPASQISSTTQQAINFWRNSHQWGPAYGWHSEAVRSWFSFYIGSQRVTRSNVSYRYRFHGGQYFDYDRQLTNWLRWNTNNSGNLGLKGGYSGMWFREFDITSYPARGHARDAYRIVREMRFGHTFVTFDHYGNFTYIGRT